jgi:hypothetical protein
MSVIGDISLVVADYCFMQPTYQRHGGFNKTAHIFQRRGIDE